MASLHGCVGAASMTGESTRSWSVRRIVPRKGTIGLFAGLALFSSPAQADRFDALREQIRAKLSQERIPSISVAVALGGKVVWEEGFGWANIEAQIPATEHTIYSIASVSKPITATALMMLVERKQVGLDRPVNAYLPAPGLVAHVGDARDATVRRIANHSAGLPTGYQYFYEDEALVRPSPKENILRYGHIMNVPGQLHEYSNFGFGLLEYVIEGISKQKYDQFMVSEVFQKIGMNETAINRYPRFGQKVAVRYQEYGVPLPFYDTGHIAASSVYSSAHDLIKFSMMHLGHGVAPYSPILSQPSIKEMQKPTMFARDAEGGGKISYGIGWQIHQGNYLNTGLDSLVVRHSGAMPGVRALVSMIPDRDLAIVILANKYSSTLQEIERSIIESLSPSPGHISALVTNLPKELIGHWRGQIETYSGRQAVDMKVGPQGVTIDGAGTVAPFSTSDFAIEKDGALVVNDIPGNIKTADAQLHPHRVKFTLRLRGDRLVGSANAVAKPLPDRSGGSLPYWLELEKLSDQ